MFCMTLRSAYRQTVRSLLVKPPSLKTGSPNRLVVTMGTTRPVSARAALNSSMIRARSLLLDPGGIRSSSWKVMPNAPSSASLCTASTAARTGRVASPNMSRACQPTVHRPKLNLSSRVGLIDIGVLLAGVGCLFGWGCVGESGPAGLLERGRERSIRVCGAGLCGVLERSLTGHVDAVGSRVVSVGPGPDGEPD